VIELDFVAAGSAEHWARTGAAASEEESLEDLYAGRLRFAVNGIDLSPMALVPFLAVVLPMNEFLAAQPPVTSTNWAVSDQLPEHRYSVTRVGSGRVRLSASWSGAGTTCPESALRAAWGCFTGRVVRELDARDPSIDQNVVVRRMMPAVLANQSIRIEPQARLVLVRGQEARGDGVPVIAAADAVSCAAWSYGGFAETGADPIMVELESGATTTSRPWSGEMDESGHPILTCVLADGVDAVAAARVIRDGVVTVLAAWGAPEDSPLMRGLRAATFSGDRTLHRPQ
jgi:hypothetical protein